MSDEFGQVGPEKPRYVHDIAAIINELTHGATAVNVKFSARSTTRHIVLTTLHRCARIDADPEGFGGQDALFVAIDNGKAAWLPIDFPLDPSYIHQYLGTPFGTDTDESGSPLSELINAVAAGVRRWSRMTTGIRP
jgi:hypothetical protein